MVLQELSQDTVRLIKSTEIITTPFSVVKELLENSIDAGATTVSVRLENHGFTLVEVRDDGSGIKTEDLDFIAKPNFTSKISTFADLASLHTYGFRGEALASLCAVAEVSVRTKTAHDMMGHTYTFDKCGSVASKEPAASTNGTTIMVENLFKNLPVRRHYFNSSKRQKEELKKVEDLMLAFALAAPKVRLTLSHDRHTIIQKGSVKSIQEALITTFPAVYNDLVLKEKSKEEVHVEVHLPKSGPRDNSNLSRTTPDRFFVIVNERPVIYKSIQKHVKAFYSQKVQGCHGRYPLGVVSVTVPPASMDINLEPNKTKILLRKEDEVLQAIQEILSELYGPLEQPNKPSSRNPSDLHHKIDITCSYGGFHEDSEMLENKVNNTQNAEQMARPFGVNRKSKASLCNERLNGFKRMTQGELTTHVSVGGGGSGRAVTEAPQISVNLNNVPEIVNASKIHSLVKPVEKEQEVSNCTIDGAVISNIQMSIDDKDSQKTLCNKEYIVKHTSTQKDLTVGCFSPLPESVIPDDDFDDFLMDSSLSVGKSLENGLSGIAPLSLSYVEDVLCQSDDKKNEEPKEADHRSVCHPSDNNEGKLYESLTGSDGIPVYQIPTLPQTDEAEKENGNGNYEQSIHPRRDMFGKASAEHLPRFTTNTGNIQDDKPTTSEEKKEVVGGAWSRGRPVDGKNIQTVQLLSTAARGLKLPSDSSSAQDTKKTSKRCGSSEDNDMLATPPKKNKTRLLASAGNEYVCGESLKKPSSPFLLFTKDAYHQVLSEHPGADFTFVAKEMADRWKALDPDSKNHYKELAKAQADKYHMRVKQIRESRLSIGSPLGKGCKTAASLDRYVAPLTPYIKKKEGSQQQCHKANKSQHKPQKEIRCSLEMIKNMLKKKDPPKKQVTMSLLGQVTASGGWVFLQGSDIFTVNVYRVYEVVLYNNLLKNFKFSMKPLDEPLPFNISTVGMDNWATLVKLPRELVPDRNFYCITDQRLIANGFHVTLYPGVTTSVPISHGEITQMTGAVGYYGITDLKEILSILTGSPRASLHQTRPLKLQHWIKAEAVRMVRSAPNILKPDEVLEKVQRLQLLLDDGEGMNQLPIEHRCIHGKPLFTKLYSLKDLPCSKQNQSKDLKKIAI